jgi:hypothetical protein
VETDYLRRKPVLVRVTADASDPLDAEVERSGWEAGLLKEGHDERAEAAINVQTDVVLLRKLTKRDDVVLAAVGEVHCRADDLRMDKSG